MRNLSKVSSGRVLLALVLSSSLLGGVGSAQAQEVLVWGQGLWGSTVWGAADPALDSDGDGTPDLEDAFPADAAASLDYDSDGQPDEWNMGCDIACQEASGLVLDEDDDNDGVLDTDDVFTPDSTEWADSDGDGVGDNADNAPLNASIQYITIAEALPQVVDDTLRQCIIEQGGPQTNLTNTVGSLNCFAGPVSSLNGISLFSHLEFIGIANSPNQTDISDIATLTRLRGANLNGQNLTDISALSRLYLLEHLSLLGNDISDLSPLSDKYLLRTLGLEGNNNLTSIQAIRGSSKLEELDVANTGVNDYSNIASDFPNMQRLRISGNGADLSSVYDYTNLYELRIVDATGIDLSAITSMSSLRDLGLINTDLVDFSSLSGMTNLESLNIYRNPSLNSFEFVSGLTNLRYLEISENPNVSLDPIAAATQLERLVISDFSGSSLDVFANLTNLRLFAAGYSNAGQITDISAVLNWPLLEHLNVSGNAIVDISVVEQLTNLRELFLTDNQVTTIGTALNSIIPGGYVNLQRNPLLCSELDTFVAPEGVQVDYDPNLECELVACPTVVPSGISRVVLTSTGGSGFAIDDLEMSWGTSIDFEDASFEEFITNQYQDRGVTFNVLSDDYTSHVINLETGAPTGTFDFGSSLNKALHIGANNASLEIRFANPTEYVCYSGDPVGQVQLRLGDGDDAQESFRVDVYAYPDFEGSQPTYTKEYTTGAGTELGGVTIMLSEFYIDDSVDSDNDGVPDIDDDFPNNPAASLDTDGDGMPDEWNAGCDLACIEGSGLTLDDDDDNDGVVDTLDAFPRDPSETRDLDGDSIGDNADVDADGDGTQDIYDAFEFDASETVDTDADGIGDAIDADDDNDGVPDASDGAPLDSLIGLGQMADPTGSDFSVIGYDAGVIDDPRIAVARFLPSWQFNSDGTFVTGDVNYVVLPGDGGRYKNVGRFTGQWSFEKGVLVLIHDDVIRQTVPVSDNWSNIDWNKVSAGSAQVGVTLRLTQRIALVESSELGSEVLLSERFDWFVEDSVDWILNPELPIASQPMDLRIQSLQRFATLSSVNTTVGFTQEELSGRIWMVDGVTRGGAGRIDGCLYEATCAEQLQFNADGSGLALLSNRAFDWSLDEQAMLTIVYRDDASSVVITKLESSPETSVVLVSIDSNSLFYRKPSMWRESTGFSISDMDLFKNKLLIAGGSVTSSVIPRSNGFITAIEYLDNGEALFHTIDGGANWSNIPGEWSFDGTVIESNFCIDDYIDAVPSGLPSCLLRYNLLSTPVGFTDQRMYVIQSPELQIDNGFDGVWEPLNGLNYRKSNVAFWQVDTYDFNDYDADGYSNDVDAFLFDPTEWSDIDGDGIGDNSDPDIDGDGVLNVDDYFPEISVGGYLDTDSDGAPDICDQACLNTGMREDADDDNDGTVDSRDAFPLDASEIRDTDGDGVGDNADLDDDNDGLDDLQDLFPKVAFDVPFIAADLTDNSMPFGLVDYNRGALEDPSVQLGGYDGAYMLRSADFSYRGTLPPQQGSWSQVQEGYVLTQNSQGPSSFVYGGSQLDNINWHGLGVQAGDFFALAPSGQIELESRSITRLVVLEKGPVVWRLARQTVTEEYAVDTSLVIDPDKPVRIFGDTGVWDQYEILSPETQFLPFDVSEMPGTWAFNGVNSDDVTLTTHCISNYCSDLVTLFEDGSAITELSGRTAAWQVNQGGSLVIVFDDNDTEMVVDRILQGADTATVMTRFETDSVYYAGISMMLKQMPPGPLDLLRFLNTPLSSGFNVTDDDGRYGSKSVIDGLPVANFGFVLNGDGSGLRFSVSDLPLDLPADLVQVYLPFYVRTDDVTWQQNNNQLVSELCRYREVDGVQVCYYRQTRTWELLKATDTRLFVHESLYFEVDSDYDGVMDELQTATSRLNMYEVSSYYDLNDVDRDSYANDVDRFPTDPTEWRDSDGDGIGDNSDEDTGIDTDGDGVLDLDDAFDTDAAASVDTDGDGLPDDWNDNATQTQIDASSLILDDDDDNDGVSDEQELLDGTDPRDPNDFVRTDPGISGVVYHWSNHTLMPDVLIERIMPATDGSATASVAAVNTATDGAYTYQPSTPGAYKMSASLAISDRDLNRTITSSDALAALKIAVGLNPNADPDGSGPLEPLPVSPYQLIAADINQDGRVTSLDALQLLKLAVGLADAGTPRWAFVEDTQALWESHASQGNVYDAEVAYELSYPEQVEVNFAAILVGDVNASWQAPEGSMVIAESYFTESSQVSGAPLFIWGLRDSDGDGLSDSQEAMLGTNPNSTDSDGDGLSDSQEAMLGTNPNSTDSDGDGVSDAEDANPLDASRSALATVADRVMAEAPLAVSVACDGATSECDSASTGSAGTADLMASMTDLSTLTQAILLRGDMNDWGVEHEFTPTATGEYQVLVGLSPGSYAFKVATADWLVLDLGAVSLDARVVALDQAIPLASDSTEVLEITVESAGIFLFTLSQGADGAMHLMVIRETVH